MIFSQSLRRELTSTAGGVFTTLFTITVTVMLIKILGQAANGVVGSADVMALILFQSINYMSIILILTVFISVLLVMTRSYQESEMVVWFSSGVSLVQWIRPVMIFGLPVVFAVALLSLFASPWALLQSQEFRERFEKREDIARVSPGKFQESAQANRIFFVEGLADDASQVRNIFIHTTRDHGSSLVVAKTGEVTVNDKGEKYVVLDKGRRYDNPNGSIAFEMIEFERYGVLVDNTPKETAEISSSKMLPVWDLVREPSRFHDAELLWRIGQPLMAFFLMLLAIPLAFANPRGGRSIGLLIALLIFFTYSNAVSFFQAYVSQGRMGFSLAWWLPHLGVMLFVMFLFSWRLLVNSPYHPLALWAFIRRTLTFKRQA